MYVIKLKSLHKFLSKHLGAASANLLLFSFFLHTLQLFFGLFSFMSTMEAVVPFINEDLVHMMAHVVTHHADPSI